ncbi:MAG: bifunctional nuclease family protein [Paludibacter sp.]|nr:bifunctional nuclease family protein [Paludibacter sp.]
MLNDEIKIRALGLVYNQTMPGTYALVMGECEGNRRFSVTVGEPEAQSIALKLNNRTPARPLTHDLINNLLITFGAWLEKVVIYDMINEVFYSELHILRGEENIIVDARTSDAVALAIRCESPIYIKEEILNIVGIFIDPESESQQPHHRKLPEDLDEITDEDLKFISSSELQQLLDRAVHEEYYELAVRIRNEKDGRN